MRSGLSTSVRMLGLIAAGGVLEFYDFVIFVFLADVIASRFFPAGTPVWLSTLQAFGIFATGYIFRPLGGVVLAHFGDLFGRKNVFAFSILLMAGSTLGVAIVPDYPTIGIAAPLALLVLRIAQGVAIGGEIPGAWTFGAEHISSGKAGLACGVICAGFGVGVALGAGITFATESFFGSAAMLSYGWRIPFVVGGALGLLGVQLRRKLRETPVFLALKERTPLVPEMPLKIVVRRHFRAVVISMLCTWILSASVIMFMLMVPTILQLSHKVEPMTALIATVISSLSLALGVLLGGVLFDRIDTAKFFIYGGIGLGIGSTAYLSIPILGLSYLYPLCMIIGLSGSICAGVPVVMVSSFPPHVRFSGVSLSYNLAYAFFGGLTPVGLAALLAAYPLSHVCYLGCVSLMAIALGFYIRKVPETLKYSETTRRL